jgi:hypothetical protein
MNKSELQQIMQRLNATGFKINQTSKGFNVYFMDKIIGENISAEKLSVLAIGAKLARL